MSMKDEFLTILMICALAMQRNLSYGQHVASMSSVPSRNRRYSGQQPNYSTYVDIPEDPDEAEKALIELAGEYLGIERKQQGGYRWISLNESFLTSLDKWRQRPYFCPYRPFHGKWIMTCKSDLQNVKRVTGGQIRKTISITKGEILEVVEDDRFLMCPGHEYLMTCEYYWHHAMDVLKAKLLDQRILPATKAFCSSLENRIEIEELTNK